MLFFRRQHRALKQQVKQRAPMLRENIRLSCGKLTGLHVFGESRNPRWPKRVLPCSLIHEQFSVPLPVRPGEKFVLNNIWLRYVTRMIRMLKKEILFMRSPSVVQVLTHDRLSSYCDETVLLRNHFHSKSRTGHFNPYFFISLI